MGFLKKIVIAVTSVTVLLSCIQKKPSIVGNINDYNEYLTTIDTTISKKLSKKLNFWSSKYDNSPSQYPYLNKIANVHEQLFALNGDIKNLKLAEKYYQKVLLEVDSSQVNTLHSLCRNYISQHKFKECLPLLERAKLIGHKLTITHQITFDVLLELGNNKEAKNYLSLIKNPKDFNYLIRKSKWEDHKGNLEEAIGYLELAKKIADKDNNKELKIWSYSNLGDYYGHQGAILKAYNYYIKTLQLDTSNNYALKGIAWIQYAYNRNTTEANRILELLMKRTANPDLYLFKAELAEFNNDYSNKNKFEKLFLKQVSNPDYGVMYNNHKAYLLAETDPQKAIEIAQQEITNRPTVLSYDLLAWCYFKNKEYQKALQITESHVNEFTSEPETMLRTAIIYSALNKKPNRVKSIKKGLKSAAFELGPVSYFNVKNL